jgi:hypothetical protein
MNLNLIGFFPEGNEDQLIKYDLDIPSKFESEILLMLGQSSLGKMAGADWPISTEQAQKVALMLNEKLPSGLDFFMTVVA